MRAAIRGHSFFCKLWGLLQGEGGEGAERDLRYQPGGPHPLPATAPPTDSEEAPGGGPFQVSQPPWVCPSSISLSRVRPSWERAGGMKGMPSKPFFSPYLLRVQCNTVGTTAFLFFAPSLLPPWWDT